MSQLTVTLNCISHNWKVHCKNEADLLAFRCLLPKGIKNKINYLNAENSVFVQMKTVLLATVQSKQFATWIMSPSANCTSCTTVALPLRRAHCSLTVVHHLIISLL